VASYVELQIPALLPGSGFGEGSGSTCNKHFVQILDLEQVIICRETELEFS